MASPIAVNVGTSPAQLWSGRSAPGVNSLLLMNTDTSNTVMVGTDLTSLVVPIAPNGSLSVDPGSNWYVQGSVAGNSPLVVVPNGQNNFLGISQGLGNIAIPQFQSPNYNPVTGTGWALFKDGTASFNEITLVIQANGIALLIYFPTPGLGNLIGSWAASAFTDQYGNDVPSGLNANGGQLAAIALNNPSVVGGTIFQTLLNAVSITSSNLVGGTSYEQTITFDSGGGMLFGYSTTVTNVVQTAAGTYTQTLPAGVTSINNAYCWASGAGGDGGSTSQGGNGGGAGEFAGEPTYTPSQNPFTYIVGAGGNTSQTGAGHGGDGNDTFIDAGGVFANGGLGNGIGGTGSANSIHHDGGAGGASNANSGGASGGNSGNPTSSGNAGLSASGATGAASPAAQTNSGTGGSGGNNAGNGNAGTSPGSGGGGAGKGSGTGVNQAISYAPTWSQSYYGPDANSGAPPNGKRTNSVLYQGGETASGGAFNGNQRSVFAFNRAQIASDWAGFTIDSFIIQFKNLHSWYNSGMYIELDEYTGLPGSAPSSYPSGDFRSADATLFINEGAETIFNLSTSIIARFISSNSNGLGMGHVIATSHPYDLYNYGYFDPSQIRIKVTGHTSGGGATTSGAGTDGKVSFSYASSQSMVFALSPQAGSDSNGNAFAAGYTGPVNVFQPGSSPLAIEGWHNLSLLNGWVVQNGSAPARYKLIGYNLMLVEIQLNDSSATSGVIFNMPSGYTATQGQFPTVSIAQGVAASNTAILQVATGAGGSVQVVSWTKQSKQYLGTFLISLD